MINPGLLASKSQRLAGYSSSHCTPTGRRMRKCRKWRALTRVQPFSARTLTSLSLPSHNHIYNIPNIPYQYTAANRSNVLTTYRSRIKSCYGLHCFLDGRGGPSSGSLVVSQAVPQQILVSIFTLSRLYRIGAHDLYCPRNCCKLTPGRHNLVRSDRRCSTRYFHPDRPFVLTLNQPSTISTHIHISGYICY